MCYCTVPAWWGQYDVPALLFVSSSPVLSYFTGLVLKDSGDDKRRLLTIALADHVFLAGVMFLINPKNGPCASYFPHNPRLDHVGDSLLFLLPVNIIDALKHFHLYKSAQRMGMDPVLAAMASH